MAIRYCGDVEVRMEYQKCDLYVVTLRAPGEYGVLRVRYRSLFQRQRSSASYDEVAQKAILEVMEHRPLPIEMDSRGQILIRRVFQAPCPL